MIVGFYNYLCNQSLITTKVVSSYSTHGEVYSIQYYVIKFVSDLRQVGGFLRVSSTNKTDCQDIAEILLKVALNIIALTLIIIDIAALVVSALLCFYFWFVC
jgi:hypothetical protein